MSNRADQYTIDQRADIGRVVATMRAARTPWKEIERLFDRSRWQLREYASELIHQDCGLIHQLDR